MLLFFGSGGSPLQKGINEQSNKNSTGIFETLSTAKG
jgi:hypothetical protein